VAGELNHERLMFVDEMGIHTSLAPLYGLHFDDEEEMWVDGAIIASRASSPTIPPCIALSSGGLSLGFWISSGLPSSRSARSLNAWCEF
jgi:hypothetical protein